MEGRDNGVPANNVGGGPDPAMTTARSGAAPLGLVLAGGLARRMGGGDKARIRVAGKTLLDSVRLVTLF